jgi:hypothetical protein
MVGDEDEFRSGFHARACRRARGLFAPAAGGDISHP